MGARLVLPGPRCGLWVCLSTRTLSASGSPKTCDAERMPAFFSEFDVYGLLCTVSCQSGGLRVWKQRPCASTGSCSMLQRGDARDERRRSASAAPAICDEKK